MLPDDKFTINTLVSYDSPILSNQFATLEDINNFGSEIAAARTFVFVREIEPLVKNRRVLFGYDANGCYWKSGSKANRGV